MNEWQPIETAPTDKWVLVYDPTKTNLPAVYVALRKVELEWAGGEVWYEGRYGDALIGIDAQSIFHGTHWMPLPNPPK